MENIESKFIGEQPDLARFFIPVELDRPRVLAFDSRATFLVHQKYGNRFLLELYERDPDAPEPEKGKPHTLRLRSHDTLVFFLWAALQRDARCAQEVLSLEQAADLIAPDTIGELAGSLALALAATRRPHKAEPKNA